MILFYIGIIKDPAAAGNREETGSLHRNVARDAARLDREVAAGKHGVDRFSAAVHFQSGFVLQRDMGGDRAGMRRGAT